MMSAYATDDYEFSFAKRTLANLEFIKNRVREEREAGLKDNEITDAFEVTQLLNSFIGLIVIPSLPGGSFQSFRLFTEPFTGRSHKNSR